MTKFKCLFSLLILTNIFMFNAEAGAISNNETIKIFDELCINIESANTRGAKTGFDKIKSVYPDSQMTFEQYAGLDPSRRRQEAKEAAYLEAFQKVAEIPLTPEQANILNKIGAGEPIQKVMEEFQSKYASACPAIESPDNHEVIVIFKELCANIESENTRGAKTGFDKIKSVYPDSQLTFQQYAGLDPSRRRQEAKEAAYLEAFQKVAEIPLTPEQANILNKIGAGEPIQKVMEEFQSKYASACISANN